MAKGRYSLPSATERDLRQRLGHSELRCSRLLKDSSGADEIAALDKQVAELEAELAAKDGQINTLKSRHGNLSEKNKNLRCDNAALRKEASRLRADVKVAHCLYAELERKFAVAEKKRFEWAQLARDLGSKLKAANAKVSKLTARLNKSPANSSLPPSLSPNTKLVHNSRVSTGRKAGGQPGHIGHARRRLEPDCTITLKTPALCPACGGGVRFVGKAKSRSVTELLITTKTTEYVGQDCACDKCGTHIPATFPQEALNEANYANSVKAVLTYLINSCNMSIDNALTFLYEATGHTLKVSKGTAHNFLAAFSAAAAKDIDALKARVAASPVVNSDATFTSVSGKRTYAYVYTGAGDALFQASSSKGLAPLQSSPLSDYKGTIVHDHDISYYNFGSCNAECNVHILRYLKGVCENEPKRTWASEMTALLCEANDAAKAARTKDAGALAAGVLANIGARYDAIIAKGESEYVEDMQLPAKYRPEGITLLARLKAYHYNHLLFAHDLTVPFDNNLSERLLRGIKKKLKQSGGFRSLEHGQSYYCDFLSITQTASLKGLEVLGVVRGVFDGKTGLLQDPTPQAPSQSP